MLLTVGAGFTVIVKLAAIPEQVPKVGVTVIIDVIAEPVEFVAVKEAMFPFPVTPNPVAVLLFDQEYVAPEVPEKVTAVVACPAHKVWLLGVVTVGVGLIVYVKVRVVPEQEPEVGVAVIVLVIGDAVAFVAVNAAILPFPLAPKPIAVFELDQL